ncbi:MAG: hypothetical protein A2173_08760 [Planctomycetes bacterium RBG_13_44_8b]|nr:MAG: hypothetical protein A2173_08760 [Planctomycetes bacterium RBG_13_44_8b]
MKKSIARKGSVLTEIAAGIVIISVVVAFLLPYFQDTVGRSRAAEFVKHLASLQTYSEAAAAPETE